MNSFLTTSYRIWGFFVFIFMLSKNQVQELKEIIKEDFGQDLSEKEVFEIGQNLVNFFEILIEQTYEKNNQKS